MQPKAPHVLRIGRAGRVAKEGGKVLDPLHLVMLGSAPSLRIDMSSIMRRRNGLMACSVMGCSCLERGCRPLHLKTGRPIRYTMSGARSGTAAPYRASGLVL